MGKSAPSSRAHAEARIPAPIPADQHPKNIEAPRTPPPSSSPNDNDTANDTSATAYTPSSSPSSRKQKRAAKKNKSSHTTIDLPTPPTSTTPTPKSSRPTSPSIPPSMRPSAALHAAEKAYPLLIASIGNPGSTYAHTLHSAGHTITSHIASVKSYKPFTKGLSGLVARPDHMTYSFNPLHGFRRTESAPEAGGDDWTFWQSTSLMNVSGKSLSRAWREFVREKGAEARLVVVHDELEAGLGKVSVRDGAASAKGHNGIKSAQASLGGMKWWRVGVGIGRPESREPNVVARYVLRKMNAGEMRAMETACGGVVDALREIAEGKR